MSIHGGTVRSYYKSVLLKIILTGFFLITLPCSVYAEAIIFSNSFDSEEEIASNGGIIVGTYFFEEGVENDAIYLAEDSAVTFTSIGDLQDKGTIEFWIKPAFNIKKLPKKSTAGLLEIGDFPFTDTFGVWAYKSEYGPVIVFEIKNFEGNFKQAWSKVNLFKHDIWHHIALVWRCNQEKKKKNYAKVYIDGRPWKKTKKLCKEIILENKSLRIGTTGYYIGRTKSIDKLEIYDYIKKKGEIKRDYKKFSNY
jgi:hypothetical protein